jgi:hypothetical protein
MAGADPVKYALLNVDAGDGTKSLHGDALMLPLVESSLSIWALVGRTVQKLGEPLPDIHDIVRHVTHTVGTSSFGVPRVPPGHHPRHSAVDYLTHLWPQILPVAQRFCRKPMQMPVLFGIALQRAIEHTKDKLSPTLGASIAMECAVAMARVALPGADANSAAARPAADATVARAAGTIRSSGEAGAVRAAGATRTTRARKKKTLDDTAASAPRFTALVTRIPPAARIVTIASLAFMTVAVASYGGNRGDAAETSRGVRELADLKFRAGTSRLARAIQVPQSAQDFQPEQDAEPGETQQSPEEASASNLRAETAASEPVAPEPAAPESAASDSATDNSSNDYAQPPPQPGSDGSDEGVMRDEYGQPLK